MQRGSGIPSCHGPSCFSFASFHAPRQPGNAFQSEAWFPAPVAQPWFKSSLSILWSEQVTLAEARNLPVSGACQLSNGEDNDSSCLPAPLEN